MAEPKNGDVLKWVWGKSGAWAIMRLVSSPCRTYGAGALWEAAAVVVSSSYPNEIGERQSVVFERNTVEESGWEYVETPFQQFVREVLDAAEIG